MNDVILIPMVVVPSSGRWSSPQQLQKNSHTKNHCGRCSSSNSGSSRSFSRPSLVASHATTPSAVCSCSTSTKYWQYSSSLSCLRLLRLMLALLLLFLHLSLPAATAAAAAAAAAAAVPVYRGGAIVEFACPFLHPACKSLCWEPNECACPKPLNPKTAACSCVLGVPALPPKTQLEFRRGV